MGLGERVAVVGRSQADRFRSSYAVYRVLPYRAALYPISR